MIALLPAFLCVGGMVLCFVMMSRMHGKDPGPAPSSGAATNDEVTALRDEVTRLRVEVRDNATHDAESANRSLN